jgi:hypothetical protein
VVSTIGHGKAIYQHCLDSWVVGLWLEGFVRCAMVIVINKCLLLISML